MITLYQPLKSILYLQGFGANPDMYKQLGVAGHIGVDYNYGVGQPIKAPARGQIVYIADDTVVLLTEDWLEVTFSHGNNYQVSLGQHVNAGQVLCYQGSTGKTMIAQPTDTTWSHVHLGVRIAAAGKVAQQLRWDYSGQPNCPVDYHVVECDASMDHFRDPNLFIKKVVERMAAGIIRMEGANPSRNNPGDLRSSPYANGSSGGFATFDTYQKGYDALIYQLTLACTGRSSVYTSNLSIRGFLSLYAPSSDNNYPLHYAQSVVEWEGFRGINDPITDWLLTEVEWSKKYNDSHIDMYPGYTNVQTGDPQTDEDISWIISSFRSLWSRIWGNK